MYDSVYDEYGARRTEYSVLVLSPESKYGCEWVRGGLVVPAVGLARPFHPQGRIAQTRVRARASTCMLTFVPSRSSRLSGPSFGCARRLP